MIELLLDGGGFVTCNFEQVAYIKNDAGQAIIKMGNGDVFLPALAYDDLLDAIQRMGLIVHLDRETRETITDEDGIALVLTDDDDEE
jgi:hypothetical protein